MLWSVREGKLLDEAVEFCRKRGLEFFSVNGVAILRSATLCKMEFVRVLLNGLSQVFQYLIQQLCSRALRCGVLRVRHGFMLENRSSRLC